MTTIIIITENEYENSYFDSYGNKITDWNLLIKLQKSQELLKFNEPIPEPIYKQIYDLIIFDKDLIDF